MKFTLLRSLILRITWIGLSSTNDRIKLFPIKSILFTALKDQSAGGLVRREKLCTKNIVIVFIEIFNTCLVYNKIMLNQFLHFFFFFLALVRETRRLRNAAPYGCDISTAVFQQRVKPILFMHLETLTSTSRIKTPRSCTRVRVYIVYFFVVCTVMCVRVCTCVN